jgi:hypothetical protein
MFRKGDLVKLERNEYNWTGNVIHQPLQVNYVGKYTITVQLADGKCSKEYTGMFNMFRRIGRTG